MLIHPEVILNRENKIVSRQVLNKLMSATHTMAAVFLVTFFSGAFVAGTRAGMVKFE